MENLLPKDEGKPYIYKAFPFASTSPDGDVQVFNSEAEIPAGWTTPDGVKAGKSKEAPVKSENTDEAPKTDSAGTAFDPALHTGTLTKAGLWRMKVGVSRPEPTNLDL